MRTYTHRPVVDGMKQCAGCNEWLAVDQFRPAPNKYNAGALASTCFTCHKVAMIANAHKISIDDVKAMHLKEECDICGMPHGVIGNKGRLHVDHSHKTGKVRGLLCCRCNSLLGMCKEDVTVLKLAIEYLKR